MAVILRCPDCNEKFRWDFSQPGRWPKACPCCGARMDDEDADDTVICMPSLRSAKTVSADNLYRQMEAGSEFRAQKAAELAGCDVADMSSLKMTNMHDGRKQGEMSAIEVKNTVSEFMQANPGIGGFQGGDAVGYSGSVQTGPTPNAGAHMRTMLQGHHAQATGGAVSDRPALETLQPGYRRRG